MSFLLADAPIQPLAHADDAAGGFVTFEGKVRNQAAGQTVVALEYEAFPDMAIAQGEQLVNEAVERFELRSARVIHRVGKLVVGDTAVVVQTASAHRRAAFEACEWMMDQLKWRVPIWKRETYATGVSEWVMPHKSADAAQDTAMFARQMRLPQVGERGQMDLSKAKVLLVGVGGLASGSLPALVGAGIGTIGLVDADLVDVSNLHRQPLYAAEDVGRSKVERAAWFATRLRPAVTIQPFPENLTASNAEQLVSAYDWVVDGTDSLATKFLLDRVCKKLGRTLVTASVHQFEGQIMTIVPGGPSLRDLFPTPPPDNCVGTCAQTGVLGVVPSVMGVLQANEVIKGILGLSVLDNRLILLDLQTLELTSLRRTANVCTSEPELDWSLDPELSRLDSYEIIDIRELDESPVLAVPHRRIPMQDCYQLGWDRPTLFVCATGRRSYRLVADLRARNQENVYSLNGGIASLTHD